MNQELTAWRWESHEVKLDINEMVTRFPIRVETAEIDDQVLWITNGGEAFDKAVQGLNIAHEIYRLVWRRAQGEALTLPVVIDLEPIGPWRA